MMIIIILINLKISQILLLQYTITPENAHVSKSLARDIKTVKSMIKKNPNIQPSWLCL